MRNITELTRRIWNLVLSADMKATQRMNQEVLGANDLSLDYLPCLTDEDEGENGEYPDGFSRKDLDEGEYFIALSFDCDPVLQELSTGIEKEVYSEAVPELIKLAVEAAETRNKQALDMAIGRLWIWQEVTDIGFDESAEERLISIFLGENVTVNEEETVCVG